MGFPAGRQTRGRHEGKAPIKLTAREGEGRWLQTCKSFHPKPALTNPKHFLSDLLSLAPDTMFGLHVTECYLSTPSREFYFLKISSEPHFQNACSSLAGINRSVFTVLQTWQDSPGPRGGCRAMSRLERGFWGSAGTRQNGVIKIIFKRQTVWLSVTQRESLVLDAVLSGSIIRKSIYAKHIVCSDYKMRNFCSANVDCRLWAL